MQPVILIIEPRPEVADALEEVVTSARYDALVRAHVETLTDLGLTPAAIIVRVAFEGFGEPAHAAIARFPRNRPPVIAIAWEDREVTEAMRLGCEIVLRAPGEVGRLCHALTTLVNA